MAGQALSPRRSITPSMSSLPKTSAKRRASVPSAGRSVSYILVDNSLLEAHAMSTHDEPALATSLAYYRAWASRDLNRAMTYIADDIVCQTPAGRLEGAEAFRAFMGPFVESLVATRLIAAFGDADTALIMYEAGTTLVGDAPGAECHTIRDGKISHLRIIFDRLPFVQARQRAAGPGGDAGNG